MKNVSKLSLHCLFPTLDFTTIAIPDMSVGSDFFGNDPKHENLDIASERLAQFQQENPDALLANGYLEERSFYNTPRFERTVNGDKEYRNTHLGTDFWVPAQTPVHAILDGEVVISHYNDFHKDYGPLLVLKHEIKKPITPPLRGVGGYFYTLYGHLTINSLEISPKGKKVKKGELLAKIGSEEENGHWVPHLHFQLITDLLGESENYNGVAFPSEIEQWKELCPNPNVLFEEAF